MNSIASVLHPYNKKKSCQIKVDPDLLRLANLLGIENS